ncbi:MAG: menaquinone reductase molybdopterin-binding-like subunit QrcB [Desulfonatronovibrio sp.]
MALDRRSFITFLVGGAAGTLFTPVPWKITDDLSIWTQNWPWIPELKYGEMYSLKSTCKLCPAGCGLEIVTAAGRPVTAKGDPEHPLSKGGICPLGACSVQLLYSPSRIKGPMKKTGPGRFESVTWDTALDILSQRLSGIKGSDKLAVVSGDENGTINEVLSGFTASMGSSNFYRMPGDCQSAAQAWKDLLGGTGQVGYDIENSDYVLMLGADLLASWGTVVRNQKTFAQKKGKYVYAGPVQTGSGAVADQWIPMLPGQQESFALGIAYHLINQGADLGSIPGMSAVRRNIRNNYSPGKVSAATGVSEEKLKKTAMELLKASRPLVVSGSEFDQGSGTLSTAAGLLVNLLLGNLNKRGGLMALPDSPISVQTAPLERQIASRSLVRFMQDLEAGLNTPDVVMVYEANPVYALPQAEKTAQAFEKIPFKVSFSTFMDETAQMADLILPSPHYLERLDDSFTPYGSGQLVYSAARPVIDPIFDTRETAEIIFEMAESLDIDLGYNSLERVMQAKVEALGGNWRSISRGQVYTSTDKEAAQDIIMPPVMGATAADYRNGQDPLHLAPVNRMRLGSEKIAIPPFATVTIRESELSSEGFFVQMNSATAFKHSLKQDQKVTITSEAGTCEALINITETVMDDTVAVLTGFGHTAWDEFSKSKGDNVFKLLTVSSEQDTEVPVWNRTSVVVA